MKTCLINKVLLVTLLALLMITGVKGSATASALESKFRDCNLGIYEFPKPYPEHITYITSRASFGGSCIQEYGLAIAFSGVALMDEQYPDKEEVEDDFRTAVIIAFAGVLARAVGLELAEPEELVASFKHYEYEDFLEADELLIAVKSWSIYVAALSWQEPHSTYGPEAFAISLVTIIENKRQREIVRHMLVEWGKAIVS